MAKPRQSAAGLFNISFGFFGIQIGFALQNANMSRVFQTLGSSIDDLPALWIAAPLTGLLVQPIVGHLSDRTWLGRLGRRRPFFLAGAILAAIALIAMPHQSALLGAAVLLWMLDASLNISMEPFRAFVGDMLQKEQHTAGYAVQTAFIGAGAVVGSLFPYLLDHWGVSNVAPAGTIPETVRYSFTAGGAALLAAVLWTVATTREYTPEELDGFETEVSEQAADAPGKSGLAAKSARPGLVLVIAGLALAAVVRSRNFDKEMYLLAALLGGYGIAYAWAIRLAKAGRSNSMLASIVGDFSAMPPVMKRLAVVQFFSWSALFIMWINTTPVVAQEFFGATNAASPAYQQAANWVGVLFATYNGVATVAALLLLPLLSGKLGQAWTHAVCLMAGVAGFAGFFLVSSPQSLLACEIGIGIAWASILAMPYAMLASSLPQAKLGLAMGLFNAFVVLPQLLVATLMGTIMKAFFPDRPLWTMAFAAATLAVAAAVTSRLEQSRA